MALGSNSSFEQQNQFVPLSAALAGSIQTDVSHLPEKKQHNGGGFIYIPARKRRCRLFRRDAKKKKISACAHFQLKQTAGLVYNISLIILMAWILDNGEQGEKIVS